VYPEAGSSAGATDPMSIWTWASCRDGADDAARAAPQPALDGRSQFVELDRLGEVVVHPGGEA
jgi:hypothetical protein